MSTPDPSDPGLLAVTAVICTRNRAGLLHRCLAGIADIGPLQDDPSFDVLVVDNGSTDDTPAVADRWSRRLALRRVTEPRQGLSHARNRAVSDSETEVLAFLDDDVVLTSSWLDGIRAGWLQFPDAVGLAGRVELAWPTGRPTWLPESREPFYARTDLGDAPRLISHDEWPVGANMAVRREAAARIGGFDTALGYSGSSLLGNEEVDFFARLRADGGQVGYHPDAAVRHVVEADRASRRYLLRRLYAQGRSDARMEASRDPDSLHHARHEAWTAAGRATVRGWRGDLARLRRPGGLQLNAMEVATGRARQAGRAREWVVLGR